MPTSLPFSWKRLILNLLTLLALIAACLALWSSWFERPPQTQLDLIQTNLSLQAERTLDDPEYQSLARALLGTDVIETATNRYKQATEQLTVQIDRLKQVTQFPEDPQPPADLQNPTSTLPDPVPGSELISRDPRLITLQQELDALNLRTGMLVAYADDQEAAQPYWQAIQTPEIQSTMNVVRGLWATPRRILPDAEVQIRNQLDGWFEAAALQRLLNLQQRIDALNTLTLEQEEVAVSALGRLTVVAGMPVIGGLLGLVILLGWIGWIVWKKQPILGPAWEQVPWTGVEIQQVLTGWFVGFLGLSWIVPQIYVTSLGIPAGQLNYWQQALQLFLTYVSGAMVGLILIYGVTRRFRPWPADLLRIRVFDSWPLWGIAGYLVAIPLVVIAAAIAELLLPQGGGGNPILPLILESQGWGPRILIMLVVSVSAPLFEEILFRGFFLTALTRYMPMWSAIGLSGIVFAVAHLNLSDLLPLATLGILLGVIYSHSRNLLAPILLHSCWNTGSLLALLILGRG